jgi:hypothetical protein
VRETAHLMIFGERTTKAVTIEQRAGQQLQQFGR